MPTLFSKHQSWGDYMFIQDIGKIKSIEGKNEWFHTHANMPSTGNFCLTWYDENDIRYVASIKVRVELDPMYRDPRWLTEEYKDKERTMAEIADDFGVTPMTINKWLNKHNIETRRRGARKGD